MIWDPGLCMVLAFSIVGFYWSRALWDNRDKSNNNRLREDIQFMVWCAQRHARW